VQTASAADDDRVDGAKEEPPRRRRAARPCLRRTAGCHRSPLPASLFSITTWLNRGPTPQPTRRAWPQPGGGERKRRLSRLN